MSSSNDIKSNPQRIGLGVITFRRPTLLGHCIDGLLALDYPEANDYCIFIVDNDAEESAREIVSTRTSNEHMHIYYHVEPHQGIANARNALLEQAIKHNCDWLAMLDDDEYPDKMWLTRHLQALEEHKGLVSVGPVLQTDEQLPGSTSTAKFTSKHETGSSPRHVATNNVIMHKCLFTDAALRFDPFYNHIGGEDFDFFNRSAALGHKQIWCADALMYEYRLPNRQTLRYLLYRHITSAINGVLRYRKDRGYLAASAHYLPKAVGKLLGALVSLLLACIYKHKENYRNFLKKLATATGYVLALLNIVIERYRHPDGY